MKKLKYIIYALQDPISLEIRYIGKSANGLIRANAHVYHTDLKTSKSYKSNWIRQLKNQGLKPIVKLVQELNSLDEINQAEQYWIKYFKDQGCPLTNATNGGMGRCGLVHSEETKQKIRLGQKNKKVARGKDHGMYGRSRTDEEKKLISKRTKEQMNTPEIKAKLMNRPSSRKFNDNHGNYYISIHDAHRKTGLSKDSIYDILNGKKSSVKGYSFMEIV